MIVVPSDGDVLEYRAVAIRFEVVRLVVVSYTYATGRGVWGMLPQKIRGYEIASETIVGSKQCKLEAR